MIRDDLDKQEEKQIDVRTGTTVNELLRDRNIPTEEVLVSRNGTIISSEHKLEEDDTIKVLDVIAGG